MSRKINRLKPKKIKGRVQTLKVLPYLGNMVYVQRIMSKNDHDIFQYIAVFKDQVYSNYIVIAPKKGKTKLSKEEVSQCVELIWAGATATLETLLNKKLDTKKAGIVKAFEGSRKQVEGMVN
jgi:hypothetical protein